MTVDRNRILTVPSFNSLPWLVHGFGTTAWAERDFSANKELQRLRPVYLRQIHTDMIRVPDDASEGCPEGDAWITDTPGVLLVIKTADCLPLLLVAPKRRAVGAVHCGWKSTLLGIAAKAVRAMEDRLGVDPASMIAALGPCIEASCLEVGPEVDSAFRDAGLSAVLTPHPAYSGRSLLDIRAANRQQLLSSGMGEDNILSLDFCTRCEPVLHSWRRDRDPAARMLNFIGIRPLHRLPPQ